MEVWLLVRDHVGRDVAEGRVWLVFDAVVEGLDDVFLELRGCADGGTTASRSASLYSG